MGKEIFDILPQECMVKIDELGYGFLADNGYKTDKCIKFEKRRKQLANAMKRHSEELVYKTAIDSESGRILLWFELIRAGKKVATSRGICFVREGEMHDKDSGQ